MEKTEIYLCEPWNYLEEKDGKYLFVWSNLPRWMVVDRELYLLLKNLNDKDDIDKVVENLSELLNKDSSEIKKQINEIFPTLIESGIVYKKYKRKNSEKRTLIEDEEKEITDISINVTDRCNLQCKMCFNKFNVVNYKDEISSEEMKDFLNEALEFASEDAYVSRKKNWI